MLLFGWPSLVLQLNNPLVTVPKAAITIGISAIFMFHSFFQLSNKVEVLILLFTFFQFDSLVSQDSKVDNFANFLFCWLLECLVFRSWLDDPFVCKRPYEFMWVIFLNSWWVVHIPFVHMAKFKFLAHFPVDHLAHPVVSCLILLLCSFVAFAYYVIDGFVSHTTQPTFAILLRLLYSRFYMIGSYGIILCCYLEKLSDSLIVSFT